MPAPRLRDDGSLRHLVTLLDLRAIAAHQERISALADAYFTYDTQRNPPSQPTPDNIWQREE